MELEEHHRVLELGDKYMYKETWGKGFQGHHRVEVLGDIYNGGSQFGVFKHKEGGAVEVHTDKIQGIRGRGYHRKDGHGQNFRGVLCWDESRRGDVDEEEVSAAWGVGTYGGEWIEHGGERDDNDDDEKEDDYNDEDKFW